MTLHPIPTPTGVIYVDLTSIVAVGPAERYTGADSLPVRTLFTVGGHRFVVTDTPELTTLVLSFSHQPDKCTTGEPLKPERTRQ